jgi:hypothetical protein
MYTKLLQRIKYLENELESLKKNNEIVAKNIKKLFNECKIEKNKKEKFKQTLKNNLNLLQNIEVKKTFDNNILSYESFLDFLNDLSNSAILAVKLTDDEQKNKFIYGYFTKKIRPFFTVKDKILLGIIDKKDIPTIKKLNKLPFFNPKTDEFDELELFKVIFLSENINMFTISKILPLIDELYNRPSLRKKHFIVYSLDKNKIIDFEREELLKEKGKYSFVYDKTYPELESILKRESKNIPFILTLLERIDEELDEIKNSRGLINVINRILNYLELNVREEGILKMIKSLRNALKRYFF